ncbi:hypothetical protein [Schlesneria sp. DSM 10557]|uniref:hypothetical protein n=1 Tax=Schlesneria sp. DSM 10557 TaxID=3044399 RepID=UPI00359F8F90
MPTTALPSRPPGLLPRITCPHCWEHFAPEKLLWVAEHSDLLGDMRLGPEQSQRFLPTRFTVNGEAIDAKGFPCHQLACPNCHLTIPRSLLELEPLFLSIFGAPASGKSYFLAAMTWELRKTLPLTFRTSFADADPVLNQQLNEYEESVFSGASSDKLVPLATLIRKTEEQGDLYDTVSYGNQTVSYPRPFLFSIQPQPRHPNSHKAAKLSRTVCLYDNAGESFQPGKDTAATPVTRHMAQSRVLFFVFDPTQDARFQRLINQQALRGTTAMKTMRQEPILQEAIARIRRFAGLKQSDRHKRPLVVILTKFDMWWQLLESDPLPEPWLTARSPANANEQFEAFDSRAVERQSSLARNFMLKCAPEIVTAAENFADDVTYVPVTAVGWQVSIDTSSGLPAIKPSEASPYWATVPFLYGLHRSVPGLIPVITKRKTGS